MDALDPEIIHLEPLEQFYFRISSPSQKLKQKTPEEQHALCWAVFLLLIMLTSLAPSPMAKVTAFLCFFTSSTTWAFWSGVTLQQTTVLHMQARSSRSLLTSLSRAWAYVNLKIQTRKKQEREKKCHLEWQFLITQLIFKQFASFQQLVAESGSH